LRFKQLVCCQRIGFDRRHERGRAKADKHTCDAGRRQRSGDPGNPFETKSIAGVVAHDRFLQFAKIISNGVRNGAKRTNVDDASIRATHIAHKG